METCVQRLSPVSVKQIILPLVDNVFPRISVALINKEMYAFQTYIFLHMCVFLQPECVKSESFWVNRL